jgi:hypothetical protein
MSVIRQQSTKHDMIDNRWQDWLIKYYQLDPVTPISFTHTVDRLDN